MTSTATINISKTPGAEILEAHMRTQYPSLSDDTLNEIIRFAKDAGPKVCKMIAELELNPFFVASLGEPYRGNRLNNLKEFAKHPKAVEALMIVKNLNTITWRLDTQSEDVIHSNDEKDEEKRKFLIKFSNKHPEVIDTIKKLNFNRCKDNYKVEGILWEPHYEKVRQDLIELAKRPILVDAIGKLDISKDIYLTDYHSSTKQIFEALIEGSPAEKAKRTINRCLDHEAMFNAVMDGELETSVFHGNTAEFKENTKKFYKTFDTNIKSTFSEWLGKGRSIGTGD